jgi:ABC-2 type transport system ATP-binding protein
MIRTQGLCKYFQRHHQEIKAVDSLDLQVHEGEVFGFLGPNGAGKTTTVRLLSCLIGPTKGRAWVNDLEVGKEDQKIRAQVGILTEAPGLYDRLSARRNLEIYAELYGVADVRGQVEKYLRFLELWEQRDVEAGTFSKGMKQKLAIALPGRAHQRPRPRSGQDRARFHRVAERAGAYHLSLHPQSR